MGDESISARQMTDPVTSCMLALRSLHGQQRLDDGYEQTPLYCLNLCHLFIFASFIIFNLCVQARAVVSNKTGYTIGGHLS